jgi:hypothetical protein
VTTRRALAPLLAVVLSIAACANAPTPSASPSPTSRATQSPVATPSSPPLATPTPSPTHSPSPPASPSPSPTLTPAPTATPEPTAPTAEAFWAAAASAVEASSRLRVRVIGPAPGELRYQSDRSATVIDGNVVFVCLDGRAYDGQSGFEELPGAWTCGSGALVRGFRLMGQALDAWNAELPPDQDIVEVLTLEADGTWRWDYRARNPFAGGDVRTVVVIDPASGQIRSASRTDPTGATTYGISYSEAFAAIALP